MAYVVDTVILRVNNCTNYSNIIFQLNKIKQTNKLQCVNKPSHAKQDAFSFFIKFTLNPCQSETLTRLLNVFVTARKRRQRSETASFSQKYRLLHLVETSPDVSINSQTCLRNGFRITNESFVNALSSQPIWIYETWMGKKKTYKNKPHVTLRTTDVL